MNNSKLYAVIALLVILLAGTIIYFESCNKPVDSELQQIIDSVIAPIKKTNDSLYNANVRLDSVNSILLIANMGLYTDINSLLNINKNISIKLNKRKYETEHQVNFDSSSVNTTAEYLRKLRANHNP